VFNGKLIISKPAESPMDLLTSVLLHSQTVSKLIMTIKKRIKDETFVLRRKK